MSSRLSKKKMKKLLDDTSAAIENSRKDTSLLKKLKEFGYTEESLQTGEGLRKEAELLYLSRGPKVGKRVSLTLQITKKIDDIYNLFMLYKQLLRRDLKENPALFRELGLSIRGDYSISGKVIEPRGFYENCQKDEKLAAFVRKYGLTKEKMESHLQAIAEVEQDSQFRALSTMESEKATEDRHEAFRRLKDWWYNYRAVLRYIFRDDPQRLEAFNIRAYAAGYKPSRKKGKEKEADPAGTDAAGAEEVTTEEEAAALPAAGNAAAGRVEEMVRT